MKALDKFVHDAVVVCNSVEPFNFLRDACCDLLVEFVAAPGASVIVLIGPALRRDIFPSPEVFDCYIRRFYRVSVRLQRLLDTVDSCDFASKLDGVYRYSVYDDVNAQCGFTFMLYSSFCSHHPLTEVRHG